MDLVGALLLRSCATFSSCKASGYDGSSSSSLGMTLSNAETRYVPPKVESYKGVSREGRLDAGPLNASVRNSISQHESMASLTGRETPGSEEHQRVNDVRNALEQSRSR